MPRKIVLASCLVTAVILSMSLAVWSRSYLVCDHAGFSISERPVLIESARGRLTVRWWRGAHYTIERFWYTRHVYPSASQVLKEQEYTGAVSADDGIALPLIPPGATRVPSTGDRRDLLSHFAVDIGVVESTTASARQSSHFLVIPLWLPSLICAFGLCANHRLRQRKNRVEDDTATATEVACP